MRLTREHSWTRYKLNRPAFFRKYIKFFEFLDTHPENPPLDADMLKWLPLMFIVVGIMRGHARCAADVRGPARNRHAERTDRAVGRRNWAKELESKILRQQS